MKLKIKIVILCALIFGLFAAMLGVLQQDVRIAQSQWAATAKSESAAISAANFAVSDMKFATAQKLKNARKRAGLAELKISEITDADFKIPQQNPRIEIDDNLAAAIFVAQKPNGEFVEARASARFLVAGASAAASIAKWAIAGVLFGIISGVAISRIITRKFEDLKAYIENGVQKKQSERIKISEIDDLAFASDLLKQIGDCRTRRESNSIDAYVSDDNLESESLKNFMTSERRIFGQFTVSAAFAAHKSDGAFFAFPDGGGLIYGKISSEKTSVKKLADATAAREASLRALAENEPWNAFMKVSKLFDFSHWNFVDWRDGTVVREGLDFGEWSKDVHDAKDDVLLSTSSLGRVLRFYSRIDLSQKENRLDSIMQLSPDSEGGLFILIEKNYE